MSVKLRGDIYHYRFKINGQEYRGSCFTSDKKEAKVKEAEAKVALAKTGTWKTTKLTAPSFKEQAETYLHWISTRERCPVRDVQSVEGALNKWILPAIGHLPLDQVNNVTVRPLVDKMKEGKLSPKTIQNYMEHVKRIVASLMNPETGEPVYMRKWDAKMMNLPEILERKQARPSLTPEIVDSLVGFTGDMEQALYVLLGATGLRISEALAIETKHFINDGRTIKVCQQVDRDRKRSDGERVAPRKGSYITDELKTNAAHREVDLCSTVAAYFATYTKGKSGLLFHTTCGLPFRYTYLQNSWLQPRLEAMKVYTKGMGFHSFRRFRSTYLDGECKRAVKNFWMGHGKKTMADVYNVQNDLKLRFAQADHCGVNFTIPSKVAQKVAQVA